LLTAALKYALTRGLSAGGLPTNKSHCSHCSRSTPHFCGDELPLSGQLVWYAYRSSAGVARGSRCGVRCREMGRDPTC